jgi:RimJ/RimL family protein N-acetyltransferase
MDTRNRTVASPARRVVQLPRFFRWFSNQCVLRQVDVSDVPRIWKAVLYPEYESCWSSTMACSEREVADLVHAAQSDWQRGTRYMMAAHRKQTQEFVGWISARAPQDATKHGVWSLEWFIHPEFITSSLTLEVLAAGTDLLMNVLDARVLRADCPAGHTHFEEVLQAAGYAPHVPAGSLDPATGRARAQALYVLTQRDWQLAHGAQNSIGPTTLGGYTQPKLELSLL